MRMSDVQAVMRLLIPSKVAGSIIGKGGNNINRLRTDFNAVVQVPDCSGPERVVSISGTDQDTAVKIVEQIVPCLEEFFSSGKGEVDIRLLVHQSLAGCVIGKGGSKVKELREKTSAKIKIFGNCCPQSTDRVVSIVGQPQVAVNGLKEIVELLKDTPMKGYTEPYDPQNFDEEYSEEYGGFGIPGGPRGPVWEPPRGGNLGGMGNYGPPMSRGGYNDRNFQRDIPQDCSEQLTIPKDLAGAIIGKGGNRIRRVRSESGADITIGEPLPGSDDRVITIKGTRDQIQLAQHLLEQAVRQSQSRY